MATLRFNYGTMGSGKSTLALQINHNLTTRGLAGLLLTKLDRDGGQVTSRLGVSTPAIEMDPGLDLYELALSRMPLQFIVCDEAQFCTTEQCDAAGAARERLTMRVWSTTRLCLKVKP